MWVGMWGEAYSPPDLKVIVVPVVNGILGATVPWVAGYKGDTPQATGALKARISKPDQYGWATVTLQAAKDQAIARHISTVSCTSSWSTWVPHHRI